MAVGEFVGAAEGAPVKTTEGLFVGMRLGTIVGFALGFMAVGFGVGG